MHETTDEGWDTQRLAILVLKSLFGMQKTIGDIWDIETCDSDTNVAVLHANTTEEGWDP